MTNRPEGLGATGEFPEGKIREDDEGEIRLAIAADPGSGNVIIDFGTAVTWLGLPPTQAIQFGQSLIEKGRSLLAEKP